MISHRPTRALIDIEAFKKNMRLIKKKIGPDRGIIAVVKANGYGHGMPEIANAAQDEDAAMLAVATIDEAIMLRRLGFELPIIILGPILVDNKEAILAHRFTASLGSIEIAKAINNAARKWKRKAKVHIVVDTGMGRFGFWHKDMPEVLDALKDMHNLNYEGIYTHFSESDARSRSYTREQLKNFNAVLEICREKSLEPPIKHAANSGAILQYPESYFDMVRPGIMLYGLYPSAEVRKTLKIHPVMRVVSKVVLIRDVGPGRYLSYGRTYQTKSRRKIATIPIGYGDGYPRHLSNLGYVIIGDRKAPVLGRITMDQILVDVTKIPKVAVGHDVLIFGKQGKSHIPIEEVAESIGTISYEIVCQLTSRLRRFYLP